MALVLVDFTGFQYEDDTVDIIVETARKLTKDSYDVHVCMDDDQDSLGSLLKEIAEKKSGHTVESQFFTSLAALEIYYQKLHDSCRRNRQGIVFGLGGRFSLYALWRRYLLGNEERFYHELHPFRNKPFALAILKRPELAIHYVVSSGSIEGHPPLHRLNHQAVVPRLLRVPFDLDVITDQMVSEITSLDA